MTILKCVLWTWVNENTVTGKGTHTQSVFVPSLPPLWCSLSGPLRTWAAPRRSENRNSPPASSPTRTETTWWFHEGNLWQKTHVYWDLLCFYYLKNYSQKNIFKCIILQLPLKIKQYFDYIIMAAYTLHSQTFLFWRLLQNNIHWLIDRETDDSEQFGDAILIALVIFFALNLNICFWFMLILSKTAHCLLEGIMDIIIFYYLKRNMFTSDFVFKN